MTDRNANRPGYKKSPAGWIPKEWDCRQLESVGRFLSGGTPSMSQRHYWGGNIPWYSAKDLKTFRLGPSIQQVTECGLQKGTREIPANTILVLVRGMMLNRDFPVGLTSSRCCFNQDLKAIVAHHGYDPAYLAYLLIAQKRRFLSSVDRSSHGTGKLQTAILQTTPLAFPPLPEQKKIAKILSTWDEALGKLDALITAKERRKKALMQQLLTGRKRVKGFDRSKGRTARDRFDVYPADWRRVSLGDITREVAARNATSRNLPVLSCTKHRGLVLSEEYFGKRVYAEDTTNYRLVTRGEFAYATNHIEEGSIGYQNICDAGLVSPIYTVFKSTDEVDDAYLFRVLKSPLLVHLYRVNTSSSVDRRGSLRYDEFAGIHVWLPEKVEQRAIGNILDTCDEELQILRARRVAFDQQKRGLMQRLLTGRIRVTLEKT